MSRPKKNRIVFEPPLFTEFKPLGIRATSLEKIKITLDEYEAIRLADYLGMSHEEASIEMEVSRSTFSRLIVKSRKKVAELLLHGKLLQIDGGNIHFSNNILRCKHCGHIFKMPMNESIDNCPACGSSDLLNLAGGFGHGACCKYKKDNSETLFLNNKIEE